MQHRRRGVVCEARVGEADRPDAPWRIRSLAARCNFGAIADVGYCVYQRNHAFRRCLRHLQFREPVRELLHGLEEMPRVGQERNERARCDDPCKEFCSAEREREPERERGERQHHGQIERRVDEVLHRGVVHRIGQRAEAGVIVVFSAEGAGRHDARDRLVEARGDARVVAPDFAGGAQNPLLEAAGRDREDGDDADHDHGQRRRHHEHRDD